MQLFISEYDNLIFTFIVLDFCIEKRTFDNETRKK